MVNIDHVLGEREKARRAAFSLVELLVALAILTLLVGLLASAVSTTRAASARAICADRLRQLGLGVHSYANANRQWVPRDCTLSSPTRASWLLQMAQHIGQTAISEGELEKVVTLQCPSHPLSDIPSGYVVNAFAFETAPNWSPDGPVRMTKIRLTATLPWILEASDRFGGTVGLERRDQIYSVQFHDVWHPGHLPRAGRARISDDRHMQSANVLYLDGSVRSVKKGTLALEQFDDGLRTRATPPPFARPR